MKTLLLQAKSVNKISANSGPHLRRVDHFVFPKTKMPASCIEDMSHDKKADTVWFHHRQQRLLSRWGINSLTIEPILALKSPDIA